MCVVDLEKAHLNFSLHLCDHDLEKGFRLGYAKGFSLRDELGSSSHATDTVLRRDGIDLSVFCSKLKIMRESLGT